MTAATFKTDISYRRVAQITWPVLVSQMSYTAGGILDTIMVGQLGIATLAAVGLGNFLVFWYMSFFFGLITGVNTLVAQAEGARDEKLAGRVLGQGLYLALASGVVMIGCLPFVPFLVGLTDAEPEVVKVAVAYISVRMFAGVFYLALGVFENFFRGLGQTKLPMYCGLIQLALDFFFNYMLIYGKFGAPALGAVGGAWGTAIAQGIVAAGLGAMLWLSPERRERYGLSRAWRFQKKLFGQLFKLSLPIGIQIFLEMGGVTVFTALVAGLGADPLAATNAVIQAWSVSFMANFALAVTATTLVGQAIGANEPELCRRATYRVLWLALGVNALIAFVYLAFPEKLVSLFTTAADAPRLAPYAKPLFLIVVACLALDALFNILYGAMRGAGDTRFPMLVNVLSAWLLFVPGAWYAIERWGLTGAWACFFFHLLAMTAAYWWRFRGDAWLKESLVEAEPAAPEPAPAGPEPAAV
jgi:MATE family multidrug resistance protein